MLAGVGTDILSIERMRLQIGSPAFMRRVFTSDEMDAGRRRADQANYYAKVFAAKEAVFKCFGITADELGTWLNIEIKDSEEAHPEVRLFGLMADVARARKVERVLLSLSSDTDYAVAFAAVVGEG
ncbi:MAG TPA: holo-ACP synthase [Thermoleophilia bacterium]|nr:holo-ACP synthase [Thermoleophilia bacterium]